MRIGTGLRRTGAVFDLNLKRHIVFLRGINLRGVNRISMATLRTALEEDGFRDVRTYMQSGNVLLSSGDSPQRIAQRVSAVIKMKFGFDIAVVVRSGDELSSVVRRNLLSKIATDPRRYLVTFLSAELPGPVVDSLRSVATQEVFAVSGREVYTWHPDGVGRSPLWEKLASRSLGVTATSRNWATVTALLAMADTQTDR